MKRHALGCGTWPPWTAVYRMTRGCVFFSRCKTWAHRHPGALPLSSSALKRCKTTKNVESNGKEETHEPTNGRGFIKSSKKRLDENLLLMSKSEMSGDLPTIVHFPRISWKARGGADEYHIVRPFLTSCCCSLSFVWNDQGLTWNCGDFNGRLHANSTAACHFGFHDEQEANVFTDGLHGTSERAKKMSIKIFIYTGEKKRNERRWWCQSIAACRSMECRKCWARLDTRWVQGAAWTIQKVCAVFYRTKKSNGTSAENTSLLIINQPIKGPADYQSQGNC